jgi:hypothetical protein
MMPSDIGNLIDILQTGVLIDQQNAINKQLDELNATNERVKNLEHEMRMSTDPYYREEYIQQRMRDYGSKIQREYEKYIKIYEDELKARTEKADKEYNERIKKLDEREKNEANKIKIGELFSKKRTKRNIFMTLFNVLIFAGLFTSIYIFNRTYEGAVEYYITYYTPIIESLEKENYAFSNENNVLKNSLFLRNSQYDDLQENYDLLLISYNDLNTTLDTEIDNASQELFIKNNTIKELEEKVDALETIVNNQDALINNQLLLLDFYEVVLIATDDWIQTKAIPNCCFQFTFTYQDIEVYKLMTSKKEKHVSPYVNYSIYNTQLNTTIATITHTSINNNNFRQDTDGLYNFVLNNWTN